jgi:hypothetical protein
VNDSTTADGLVIVGHQNESIFRVKFTLKGVHGETVDVLVQGLPFPHVFSRNANGVFFGYDLVHVFHLWFFPKVNETRMLSSNSVLHRVTSGEKATEVIPSTDDPYLIETDNEGLLMTTPTTGWGPIDASRNEV